MKTSLFLSLIFGLNILLFPNNTEANKPLNFFTCVRHELLLIGLGLIMFGGKFLQPQYINNVTFDKSIPITLSIGTIFLLLYVCNL